MTTEAFIYDAIRTPRGKGKPGGGLYEVKPIELLTGLLEAMNVSKFILEDVFDPFEHRHIRIDQNQWASMNLNVLGLRLEVDVDLGCVHFA